MLFDPKWEVAVKADPLSLDSLIEWLETQNPQQQYDYCWPETCAVAQYLVAKNHPQTVLTSMELDRLGWHEIAQGTSEDGAADRWTFGAVLRRARKAKSAARC